MEDHSTQDHSDASFPWFGITTCLVLLVVIVFFAWQWLINADQEPASPFKSSVIEVPKESENDTNVLAEGALESAVEVELTESQTEVQAAPLLPRLNESDPEVKAKVKELDAGEALLSLLVTDELIRKTVRAVSSLSDGWVVKEYRPVVSPKGPYLVTDTGRYDDQQQKIYRRAHDNDARYLPYVELLSELAPESAAVLYDHFYPLLQQAYEELGLQEGRFHQVVLSAIDQILKDEPTLQEPDLRQPSVMYAFVDKNIETLSSVQKLKLRLGAQNTSKLKNWLMLFRKEIEHSRG